MQRGDTTAGRRRDRRATAAGRGARGSTLHVPGSRYRERGDDHMFKYCWYGAHDVRPGEGALLAALALLMNSVRAACEVGPTRHAGGVACRRVTVRGRS